MPSGRIGDPCHGAVPGVVDVRIPAGESGVELLVQPSGLDLAVVQVGDQACGGLPVPVAPVVLLVGVVVRQGQCRVVKRVPAERQPRDAFEEDAAVGVVPDCRFGELYALDLPSVPVDDGYSRQAPCR